MKKTRGNSGRLRRNSGGEDDGGGGGGEGGGTARNGDKEDPTRTSQSERRRGRTFKVWDDRQRPFGCQLHIFK